ncbi:MAG: replication and repair protein RecF protein [Candidatus Woesebacteria bacterium GW2011_GWA1_37_8]|uniref:DNA replication and repair protein RecF n=1 Tax=Candidatus Woesebacteria bacterium GW2011_GWA1_37_8 TaxID=1618546 RepID=A0A0G0HZ56_9BACT|nr:MAG: replication and repair protein RecF protein [Candidatus Woesebacteria bacterium GW2011_GWA1_37_8]
MLINKLALNNFRNFSKKHFEFGKGVNVIVGPNAIGKTNILESIYLLSTGKSFKARLEEEMIDYNSDIARIVGEVGHRLVEHSGLERSKKQKEAEELQKKKLETILTRGEIQIGEDPENIQKAPRKKMLVNGLPKRLIDFSGILKVALFGPWDLDLVTESPSIRRKFLDSVLSQVDREYRRASLSYEKGLRQRNRLLWRIREEGLSRSQLLFWNQLLIKNGDYISRKRAEFIDFVNESPDFLDQDFSLEYDSSAISEGRLMQYKDEEVAAATTLVGPHRDDFIFKLKNAKNANAKNGDRDLSKYGSRGEQRMGVLWVKLAELNYIEKSTGERPVLLLDDIFSELDHEHRAVVSELAKAQQTIITTADEHYVKGIKSGNEIIMLG